MDSQIQAIDSVKKMIQEKGTLIDENDFFVDSIILSLKEKIQLTKGELSVLKSASSNQNSGKLKLITKNHRYGASPPTPSVFPFRFSLF